MTLTEQEAAPHMTHFVRLICKRMILGVSSLGCGVKPFGIKPFSLGLTRLCLLGVYLTTYIVA